MFEKEAKEQANKKYPIPLNWNEIDTTSRSKYEEGYHNGAEFGYKTCKEVSDKIIQSLLSIIYTESRTDIYVKEISDAEIFLEEKK